jgi:hypothetical protein
LVATARTAPLVERLKRLLEPEIQVHMLVTDPYDIPAIQQQIKECLKEAPLNEYEPEFNLTGGTKPMTFAAYAIAHQRGAPVYYLQSEGRRSLIYRYHWGTSGLQAADPVREEITAQIQIANILDAHLNDWKELKAPNQSSDGGGDFEQAIANALRNDSRFDEILVNVQSYGGGIEIDLMVRVGNHIGIIEAKWGKKGRSLDGIKQLNTTRRKFGTYIVPCYVSKLALDEQNQLFSKELGITTIVLSEYTGGLTLSANDAQKLTNELYRQLCP